MCRTAPWAGTLGAAGPGSSCGGCSGWAPQLLTALCLRGSTASPVQQQSQLLHCAFRVGWLENGAAAAGATDWYERLPQIPAQANKEFGS